MDHPITEREILEQEIQDRDFRRTRHYMRQVQSRDLVQHNQVKTNLQDLEELKAFSYKKDEKENERYNLLFSKSNKYYLMVAISFVNNHINLVTAFVTRKARGKPEELVSRWG